MYSGIILRIASRTRYACLLTNGSFVACSRKLWFLRPIPRLENVQRPRKDVRPPYDFSGPFTRQKKLSRRDLSKDGTNEPSPKSKTDVPFKPRDVIFRDVKKENVKSEEKENIIEYVIQFNLIDELTIFRDQHLFFQS